MFEAPASKKRLGDLALVITKGTTPTTYGYRYYSRGIPFLRIENITKAGKIDLHGSGILFVDESAHSFMRRSQLEKGDWVVSIAGTIGRVAVVSSEHVPGNCNQAVAIIRLRPEDAYTPYVKWYLLSDEGKRSLVGDSVQLAQANLSLGKIATVAVPLPSIDCQKKIANHIESAEAAIENLERIIAKLRQVRTGLVDELLAQAAATVAPSRLSTVALPRFSSVDKLTVAGEEPVRLCNYTDVYKHDYIRADMEFMHATATLDEIAQFRLQVGDVIITKDSESPDDIGIPCVIDTTAPDLLCGYHLALIRPNLDRIDPTYLSLQLAHRRLAAYFGQQAVGSTRYGLSVACIANAPILLPPIEEQREAGKLIRLQDAQIRQHEAELIKLQFIKSGLMDDLLTGSVRVPEAY
jgi:type I restriction enzyme S subunit